MTPFGRIENYGIADPWDACVFRALARVNGCLHRADMPQAASRLLEDIQACICSGDGRTMESAFKAPSRRVMEKVLSLLDVEGSVAEEEPQGNYTRVTLLGENAPLGAVWFKTMEKE